MRRTVLALLLFTLAGAPQAFACLVSCSEQASTTVPGHHHHHEHAEHRSSSTNADVAMEAIPHDCGRAAPLPLAEALAKAKSEQTIIGSVLTLDAPRANRPTFRAVVAQRPPGSRFLSTQLRT